MTYPEADPTNVVDRVRQAVVDIPPGRIASYGDIGRSVGISPRQVGRVMSQLDENVPWWRVVYADGTPPSCHCRTATSLLVSEHTPMAGSKVDMGQAR
ncbi:MAG: MGMT family protein [Acidimicrobiales bacterium]